ncbi:MAG: hypothetical protein LZ158_02500 [Thaumarchaeota archaeon]|jgi:hypothetical protein|nr:hypothetical protein [Candidatus Terraquivivens yellowstonensis]MCL7392989.1 hypothetical protein [Candidatus Terraquivivens yellowstonensis]MCL7397996.1 hypothetical protein [Candidatus Terraquivivens yellowstonensis]MCL7400314.1 hypothetical protein [Candidatus Terraquivivens yellowstonensis]
MFLRRLMEKVSIRAIAESVQHPTTYMTSGAIEYPIIPFQQYVDYYLSDPLIMSAADYIEQAIAGMGGYTTADVDVAKDSIDEFNAKINLDELHLKIAKWTTLCGNFFLERIYDAYDIDVLKDPWTSAKVEIIVPAKGATLVDIKPLPLSSIVSAVRAPDGTVLWYNRLYKGQQTKLSSKLVIHYRWNVVDERAFGTGWLTSMLTEGVGFMIRGKLRKREPFVRLKEKLDDASMRLAIKAIPRHVYVFPTMPLDVLKEAQSQLEKLEPEQDFLTNSKEFDVREVGVSSRAVLEFFWKHIFDQFVIGTQTHHVRLFTTPGFTEASARVADAAMERKLMAIRRFIKRVTEREIFDEFLRTHGIDPRQANVRWNWGLKEEPRIEVDHLIKFAELLARGVPVVRLDELREMLKRLGFMLTEGTEVKE